MALELDLGLTAHRQFPVELLLQPLRREQDESSTMFGSLARLFCSGVAVDFRRLAPVGARCIALPRYPWQRERHWISGVSRGAEPAGRHPLLGPMRGLSTDPGARLWDRALDLGRLPWLADHRVQGAIVLPGAGAIELLLTAGRELLGDRFAIADLEFEGAPLALSPRGALHRAVDAWRALGYEPMLGLIRRIDKNYRLCGNGQRYAACNWLVPASTGEAFCVSCRLNRTIPDLSNALNRQHWSLMEAAKRRLLAGERGRARRWLVALEDVHFLELVALFQRVLKLVGPVEVILDHALVASGDEHEMFDARFQRLVHHMAVGHHADQSLRAQAVQGAP